MAKGDRDSIVRADVLTEHRQALVRQIAEADIDILVLERSEPQLVVAQEVRTNPTTGEGSKKDITAKDMLERTQDERAGHQKRLDAVKTLMGDRGV